MTSYLRGPAAAILLFLLSYAGLFLLMDPTIALYDEGLMLTHATQVAAGLVPHRDFYVNYGPGQFYILAGLFKILGPSFVVARAYDILIRAAIVVLVFRILIARTRPSVALAAAVVCGLWMFSIGGYLYPYFPVTLIGLVGTNILLGRVGSDLSSRQMAAAGALTGGAALIRYDLGFLLLLAHGLGWTAITARKHLPVEGKWRIWFRQALFYGIGVGLIFLPAALLLLWAGGGPGFVHDIFVFMPENYARTRSLPFPFPWHMPSGTISAAAIYSPFVAVGVAAAAIALLRGHGSRPPVALGPDEAFLWLFGCLTLVFISKGMVRSAPIHFLLPIITSIVLLALLIDRRAKWSPMLRLATSAAMLLTLTSSVAEAALLARKMAGGSNLTWAGAVLGSKPTGRMALAQTPAMAPARMARGVICAAEFVRRRSSEDEFILSATMRHDKLFIFDAATYFAAQRRPGTHWYHYDPGLQTRADIQREMISDLQKSKVRWIIRNSQWDDVREPNASAISSGVIVLDRYIASRYRPVAVFDKDVSVWLRNDFTVPAATRSPGC